MQGIGLLLACMIVFFILMHAGHVESEVRATVFITIVVSNLLMMIVSRSDHEDVLTLFNKPNHFQWWVIGLTVFALILVLQVPWLATLFNFSLPTFSSVLLALSACVFALIWLEIVKTIFVQRAIFKFNNHILKM